jgi:hypothetical protein
MNILSSLLLALIMQVSQFNYTKDLTFKWDPSQSPDVIGYNFYVITNGVTNMIDAGNVDTLSLSNLAERVPYSFYVTAYNDTLESDPSRTINFQLFSVEQGKSYDLILGDLATNRWDSYVLDNEPDHGELLEDGVDLPSIVYVANNDYSGEDSFSYSITNSTNILNESDSSIIDVFITQSPSTNITYIGVKFEWWTSLTNIHSTNFNLMSFTNPPSPQFYRSLLIITNQPLQ